VLGRPKADVVPKAEELESGFMMDVLPLVVLLVPNAPVPVPGVPEPNVPVPWFVLLPKPKPELGVF